MMCLDTWASFVGQVYLFRLSMGSGKQIQGQNWAVITFKQQVPLASEQCAYPVCVDGVMRYTVMRYTDRALCEALSVDIFKEDWLLETGNASLALSSRV